MRAPVLVRLPVVAAAAVLLAGCLGDADPDPASAPLEVIIASSQQPDLPCLLNREEVAAGEHEVAVIDESGGPSRVVVRDPTGVVVLELAAGVEAVAAQGSVALAEGEHVVQCLSGADLLGEVRLSVVAAGP